MIGNEQKSGMDCLREELMKRGCSKIQAESQVVAIVLDILSQSDAASEQWKKEKDFRSREQSLAMKKSDLEKREAWLCEEKTALNDAFTSHRKELAEMIEYIESFNKALLESKDPEEANTLKKAQLFINSVNVETPQNNTAYINGLAAILSDGRTGLIWGLKQTKPEKIDGLNSMLEGWINISS